MPISTFLPYLQIVSGETIRRKEDRFKNEREETEPESEGSEWSPTCALLLLAVWKSVEAPDNVKTTTKVIFKT